MRWFGWKKQAQSCYSWQLSPKAVDASCGRSLRMVHVSHVSCLDSDYDSNIAMETHRKVGSDVIYCHSHILRRLHAAHAHVIAVTVRHTWSPSEWIKKAWALPSSACVCRLISSVAAVEEQHTVMSSLQTSAPQPEYCVAVAKCYKDFKEHLKQRPS